MKYIFIIFLILLGALVGFGYFSLLVLIGSATAGAGHGSYFLLDFAGVYEKLGSWSVAYWCVFGSLFFIRNQFKTKNIACLMFIIPYCLIIINFANGKYKNDSFKFDWFTLMIITIFSTIQLLFLYFMYFKTQNKHKI